MDSLQSCALHALSTSEWISLDPCIQNCIYFTYNSFDQLTPPCVRMAALLQLFEGQTASLVPRNTKVYGVATAHRVLKHGDHIVVLIGGRNGYVHHGIVLSVDRGGFEVAHFSAPEDERKLRLIIDSFEVFLEGYISFGIVPYCGSDDQPMDALTEQAHRERSASIARLLVASPLKELHTYDLIKWNCECFAWCCKTGGIKCTSDQVERIQRGIRYDLSKGEESYIRQINRVSKGSCVVS